MSHLQRLAPACLLVACVPSAALADPPAPILHYHFTPQQQFTYEITIRADLPEGAKIITGQSIYNIKDVDTHNDKITLTNFGALSTRNEPRPSADNAFIRPPLPTIPPSYARPRDLILDSQANILQRSDDTQLPFLLGPLSSLLLEPLSATDENPWQSQNSIQISEQQGRAFGFSPLFKQPELLRSAKENITITIESNTGMILLHKKCRLATNEKEGDHPLLEQTGEGTITFDPRLGLITSVDMKYTITTASHDVTVQIPVTLTATLLDAAKTKSLASERQARHDAARAQAIAAATPRQLSDDDIQALVEDLADRDQFKVTAALDKLALAIPTDANRPAVRKALHPLLTDRDHFIAVDSTKVLGIWGTTADIHLLIPLLDDHDVFVQKAAFESLGRLPDPQSAQAVATRITNFFQRTDAAASLKAMGPPAEPAVLPLLANPDDQVQITACQILSKIGTPRSLPALTHLTHNDNPLLSSAAATTLTAIHTRQ